MVDHKRVDAVTDIMAEIFEATQNNLTKIVAEGLVRERPIPKINEALIKTGKLSLDFTNKILGATGSAIGLSADTLIVENIRNTSSIVKQYQLKDSAALRKDLFKATIEGIEKQPKVLTKGGQRWGYKEYMEMKVRTTIAREAGDMQLEFGGEAGVVFYLCNTFQDSADDHADFQGKYYYDDRFREFGYDKSVVSRVISVINKRKLLPMQYVRENKPYLGTRPNCRHTFTPVSIGQVVDNDNPTKLSEDLGLTTGTYRDANYKATQALRVAERSIRNYKHKAALTKDLAALAKDPLVKQKFLAEANRYNNHYKAWRARRNNLVKNNKHLDLDYRRETRKQVLQDLGVKYNIGQDDGVELIADFGIINKTLPEEVLAETVKDIVNASFVNKSISKTAIQERDLNEFEHVKVEQLIRNKELREVWQPALQSLINDFTEFDVLKNYTFRINRRTTSWGTAFRGVQAEYKNSQMNMEWHYKVEFSGALFNNYDDVRLKKQHSFNTGFSSSSKLESTLIHEFGHVLDTTLSRYQNGITDEDFDDLKAFIDKKAVPYSEFASNKAKLVAANTMDFSKNVYEEFVNSDYINNLMDDNNLSHTLDAVEMAVSQYGASSKAEFFAEAFTKWYLSDTPDGEFEQTFGEIFYRLRKEALDGVNK